MKYSHCQLDRLSKPASDTEDALSNTIIGDNNCVNVNSRINDLKLVLMR